MDRLGEARARDLTLAAIGAVNRRDHLWAVEAVRNAATDEHTRVVVIDTCAAILLRGVPHGSLAPSVRIPVTVPPTPGEETWPRAIEAAAELLTGLACGDNGRVASVLRLLQQQQQELAVLLVLVRAAAAWIDTFVGIDGDTVDAYYAMSKQENS